MFQFIFSCQVKSNFYRSGHIRATLESWAHLAFMKSYIHNLSTNLPCLVCCSVYHRGIHYRAVCLVTAPSLTPLPHWSSFQWTNTHHKTNQIPEKCCQEEWPEITYTSSIQLNSFNSKRHIAKRTVMQGNVTSMVACIVTLSYTYTQFLDLMFAKWF